MSNSNYITSLLNKTKFIELNDYIENGTKYLADIIMCLLTFLSIGIVVIIILIIAIIIAKK